MKTIDLNIGLAVSGGSNLNIGDVYKALRSVALDPVDHRVANSSTEPTLIVRCISDTCVPLAERVFWLCDTLNQEAISYIEHDGNSCLVGPGAHKWGGCFLPQHWISLI